MRTIVIIVDSQIEALDRLARRQDRSRGRLICEAVDSYLGRHCVDYHDEAFGLWSKDAVDEIAFQERARSEW